VLGALEMLKDTPLTAAQARYTETASVSAEVLLTVIDETLEFSRLESGNLRIESIEFDVRKGVEDTITMLGQRAHAKALELACFIDPAVPLLLRGDPMRLRQILINLVGNAIKFTERVEVVVKVTVGGRTDKRLTLLFEVQDSGRDDYLVKPYNVDSLSTLVARWLSPPGPVDPGPTAGAQMLDQAKIDEIRGIMGPRFHDLLATFAYSVRSQLTRIRDEGTKGDRDAAFEAAHSLKNTAGELGAHSLHLAAQAIERSMHSGDDWHKLFPELEAIAEAAINAAQTIIEHEDP